MEKIDITLTPIQDKYFEAIRWLIDDDEKRGTGRSFLLAISFISKALKNRGRWIKIFDHKPAGVLEVITTIKYFLDKDKAIEERIEFRKREFRINP